MKKILLCSDLDRTILPNGAQPQSPRALEILMHLAAREEITLAYVSGRSETLLKQAISDYSLPIPDYAIGDVGTTIYEPLEDWRPWHDWAEEIGRDWNCKSREDLAELFGDLNELTPQEDDKQNTFKLSYYAPSSSDPFPLKKTIAARLEEAEVKASIIWSIDEQKDVGLIDILPSRATKVHAIRFLMEKHEFAHTHTVFAGDSGNDMEALTSGLHAVLVKNARDDVRKEAMRIMEESGMGDRLYLARGDFLGMNGNYCAGVLEGLAHFLPKTRKWMTSD
ncbi:MAG TPA: HAD-IIB family hydrolase [Desulfopila sp.]|nr:HAD-IIB family hydrolase [Desulfopila sp.]